MASCERIEESLKKLKISSKESMKHVSELQHEFDCIKLQDNIDTNKLNDKCKEIIAIQSQVVEKSKDLIIAAQARLLEDPKRQTPGRGLQAREDSGCFSVDSALLRESTGSEDLEESSIQRGHVEVCHSENDTNNTDKDAAPRYLNLIAQCTEDGVPAQSDA